MSRRLIVTVPTGDGSVDRPEFEHSSRACRPLASTGKCRSGVRRREAERPGGAPPHREWAPASLASSFGNKPLSGGFIYGWPTTIRVSCTERAEGCVGLLDILSEPGSAYVDVGSPDDWPRQHLAICGGIPNRNSPVNCPAADTVVGPTGSTIAPFAVASTSKAPPSVTWKDVADTNTKLITAGPAAPVAAIGQLDRSESQAWRDRDLRPDAEAHKATRKIWGPGPPANR